MKTCIRCNVEKPLTDYYSDRTKKDGKTPYCKTCRKEKAAHQYFKDPTKAKMRAAAARLDNALAVDVARMGITLERYQQMLEDQNHRCAICRELETVLHKGIHRRLSIDHDHACCPGRKSCGKCVRMLLCARCNSGLGYFYDNPELLQNAATYLTSHRVQ
jgi:hypothetical protein